MNTFCLSLSVKMSQQLSEFTQFSFLLCCVDILTKEEFHLKQNVEPFIHYKEKHATFECITRENIEAVAAKVGYYRSLRGGGVGRGGNSQLKAFALNRTYCLENVKVNFWYFSLHLTQAGNMGGEGGTCKKRL